MPEGTYAIALQVPSEGALEAVSARLKRLGIPHHRVIEDDAPYSGQLMALGIMPALRHTLKPHLSSYALVAQSGRASEVMTPKVVGANPAQCSILPHARSSAVEHRD